MRFFLVFLSGVIIGAYFMYVRSIRPSATTTSQTAPIDGDGSDGYTQTVMDQYAGFVRAQQAQTCDMCRHQLAKWHPDDPGCGLTRMTDGVHATVTIVPCRFLDHTCGAFEAKAEEATL